MNNSSGVIAVILGRAGSRGLPGKNAMLLCGRSMICYTIDDALEAKSVDEVIVSTDGEEIAAAAQSMNVKVIRRPADLATDDATVSDAARHAIQTRGGAERIIVILYANVPLRPPGLIDGAVALLVESGAHSVQSYQRVGKHHPAWMITLDESGRVSPLNPEAPDRRQLLPPRWLPDGGVIAVTRDALINAGDHPHDFLGRDRRGIETPAGAVVDVDTPADLLLAEAALRARRRSSRPAERESRPSSVSPEATPA